MESDRKAVSVIEAARLLGIGKNLAYDAVARGEIPSIRVGGRILVSIAAIDRMLVGAGAEDSD